MYKITHKLGLRDANNRYIYEYSKSDSDRSFVPDNNLDNILKQSEEDQNKILGAMENKNK